jgi:hypothetical protein
MQQCLQDLTMLRFSHICAGAIILTSIAGFAPSAQAASCNNTVNAVQLGQDSVIACIRNNTIQFKVSSMTEVKSLKYGTYYNVVLRPWRDMNQLGSSFTVVVNDSTHLAAMRAAMGWFARPYTVKLKNI